MSSTWNPGQYEKFKLQRAKPFFDLMELIQSDQRLRMGYGVDLGCGTGELTRELFNKIQLKELIGVDSSQEMLEKSGQFEKPGLTFELQDIVQYQPKRGLDLVFSNAALQWLPHHELLIPKLLDWVNPGGQIALQMPLNFDHPSHRTAREVAKKLFPEVFAKQDNPHSSLSVEHYAELFFEHGFEEQICRNEVYGHPLPSGEEVVEWTKGTLLTFYQSHLSREDFDRFLSNYRAELLKVIGKGSYFYAFKRTLLWEKGKLEDLLMTLLAKRSSK